MFPLIVAEGWDLEIYERLEDLVEDLEAIDVENGVYVAFDTHGRRVTLGVDGSRVTVGFAADDSDGTAELTILLEGGLRAVGASPPPGLSLEELVARAKVKFLYLRPRTFGQWLRNPFGQRAE